MRSEKEMFETILKPADADSIRAVLLVGSRANPEVPKDIYQDYDVTYIVSDMGPYYDNPEFIEKYFGKPAIMQVPEAMSLPSLPPDNDGHFTYLMLFSDYIRIDASFYHEQNFKINEPAVVLLDKDKKFNDLKADAAMWHITPPNLNYYQDCCNEFWWCLNNAAKGIARDEMPYAMSMFNDSVREMLDQMCEWYIGLQHKFNVSAGKQCKYLKKFLPASLYSLYMETYSKADPESFWHAVFCACELFRTTALFVGERFGFKYNQHEDKAITAYLKHIKETTQI